MQIFQKLCQKFHAKKIKVSFSEVQAKVKDMMKRCDFVNIIGKQNFFYPFQKLKNIII
ncbi:MAG: STAS domain-containing protein [Elusimicrobiota bacterium]|nr:STAS domain-containing protein [Elusimicrobiota bacterium]